MRRRGARLVINKRIIAGAIVHQSDKRQVIECLVRFCPSSSRIFKETRLNCGNGRELSIAINKDASGLHSMEQTAGDKQCLAENNRDEAELPS